ncbi:MAG TPA: MOSC domain-containing protein [Gemmatimonadaceae bacterium]|jgi:MOSC domain-containing protein YiiM|nr:MOSC domain-containing protein [Gemmatimonadaceae bacterium]
MKAYVESLNISDGGVPKRAVPKARVTAAGMVGDRQRDLRSHGGPDRALCVWAAELIEALRAEGHPIRAGDAGENLTLRGVNWAAMQAGARFRVGTVEAEVTGFTTPCDNLRPFFIEQRFSRISHKVHPGWSRVYARVLVEGEVAVGAEFHLMADPPAGASVTGA